MYLLYAITEWIAKSCCPFKVLFLLGLLSDDLGWNIAENAFKGGPLGELVQWSDIISAIYTLGHDIAFAKSASDLDK